MKVTFDSKYPKCCKDHFIIVSEDDLGDSKNYEVSCKYCRHLFESVRVDIVKGKAPLGVAEPTKEEPFVSKLQAIFNYSSRPDYDEDNPLFRRWARAHTSAPFSPKQRQKNS